MYEELQEQLGITFHEPKLLKLALTHRSYIYETTTEERTSNERLEFLGDSILALVSADFLYRTFPQLSEGELTSVRAVLVRTDTLASFARELNIVQFMLMGKGEQSTGAGQRVVASAFEAVLGAIYLDQGLAVAQQFLLPRLAPLAETIVKKRLFKDDKSRLQELAQANEGVTPSYRVAEEEGPSHNRIFTVEVLLGQTVAGRGQGRNKQGAEQEAAHAALENLGWV